MISGVNLAAIERFVPMALSYVYSLALVRLP